MSTPMTLAEQRRMIVQRQFHAILAVSFIVMIISFAVTIMTGNVWILLVTLMLLSAGFCYGFYCIEKYRFAQVKPQRNYVIKKRK